MRIFLMVLLIISAPALAQRATKWECKFTRESSSADTQKQRDPRKFTIGDTAFSLDFVDDGQKAFVLGNNGAAEVARLTAIDDGIAFIERTTAGSVQVTAIDAKGNAAHSRHTFMFDGVLMASQFYGTCKKL